MSFNPAELKVGDEVAYKQLDEWRVTTVSCVKCTVFDTSDGRRWIRSRGVEYGSRRSKMRLVEVTQEARDAVEQRRLANLMKRRDWSKDDLATLRSLVELLELETTLR